MESKRGPDSTSEPTKQINSQAWMFTVDDPCPLLARLGDARRFPRQPCLISVMNKYFRGALIPESIQVLWVARFDPHNPNVCIASNNQLTTLYVLEFILFVILDNDPSLPSTYELGTRDST
ncbi:hypothetical protein CBL_07103 [Carabus blaptoides fortunei]